MRVLLAFLLAMAAVAAPVLQGAPFLPYRINQGVAFDEDGLLGTLALTGLRWDGGRVTLFRTTVAARTQSAELAFYLDEDIRGLELRIGEDPPVAIPLIEAGAPDAEETALRALMRSLVPPVHLAPAASSPERYTLLGSDPASSGSQAASALFGLPVSRTPLIPLGACAILILAVSAMPTTTPGRRSAGRWITAGVTLGATLVVVWVSVPGSRLFRVVFPEGGHQVERRTEELPGYTRVTYAGPGAGTVAMVGLWAPAGRGIPVVEVAPPEARVRFSAPPLVTGEGAFLAREFVTGWVVHAKP